MTETGSGMTGALRLTVNTEPLGSNLQSSLSSSHTAIVRGTFLVNFGFIHTSLDMVVSIVGLWPD